MMTIRNRVFIVLFSLPLLTTFCGCVMSTGQTNQNESVPADGETGIMMNDYYKDYDREPFALRTILREYTVSDANVKKDVYGRYTELIVEGNAPESFRNVIAECNKRAEASLKKRVDELAGESAEEAGTVTCGYIVTATRADQTAFSILETEFKKEKSASLLSYQFHGMTYDTQSGEVICLSDLVGDDASCKKLIGEALQAQYGDANFAETDPSQYAWTLDALGLRVYFNDDAVRAEKRKEINDYEKRTVTAGIPYEKLPGMKTEVLSAAPDAYIAMMSRETEYDLPHGEMSLTLHERDGELILRILHDNGTSEDLIIEYGDLLSDFYIMRAEGKFYLLRNRIGYQEGFIYDFERPDGGFGRFANHNVPYFDSFLREILLAVPYNPYCVHLAEVKRSFGEKSYDASSFVPNGHYTFPNDPKERYKRFALTDSALAIDSYNTVCHLTESLPAVQIDEEGNIGNDIIVPSGKYLFFESVKGEAQRYKNSQDQNQARKYFYTCRLRDGTRIGFESSTEQTVSAENGYLARFTEPVSLSKALLGEETPQINEPFFVEINGRKYPLIPDYSKNNHMGEEIDFGEDLWWQVEGYTGRYLTTEEDYTEMKDAYFTEEALSHPDETVELLISENGEVTFNLYGEVYKGALPENRYYKEYVSILMESDRRMRTFQIRLREGKAHEKPEKIEFFSEGEPATNEPSRVPPISVYMTHVSDQ